MVRPGGAVLASTFAAAPEHPVKQVVDSVLREHGWVPPPWYEDFATIATPLSDTPDRLAALARHAGMDNVAVSVNDVDTGLRSAAELVRWRMGMAGFAEYVTALDHAQRSRLVEECEAAVGPSPQPLWRVVLILSSTVPA